ncbi:hypothetical protein [Pseudanabaena sp. FACHB-2040]|uniref:hypothetical protein n=1 Tax=Pseudanabaena sp. FACHB-2040 TaxID=2692859 RepID=UPI001687B5DE|nr:hypothetical protein [Pseudanabaena sp. FACHB-2040]MBD2259933.1 hypothetical protein [Pseudanabaena sp. FACHB-2040]
MARRVTLTKIDPFSLGKLQAAVLAAAGLLFGLIFGFSLFLSSVTEGQAVGGLLFAIAAVLAFPLVYGVLGFLSGYVGSLIYNLAAGSIGGIRLAVQFEDEQPLG